MRNSLRARLGMGAALVGGLLLTQPASVSAHDIPQRVAILAYLKPEGHRLRMVVRVPLEAMRDVNWPVRGPGYLDMEKLGPLLAQPAETWIGEFVHVFEDGKPLADPQLVAAHVSLPSDRSFTSYDAAVANATGPALPASVDLAWQQAMFDVVFDFAIASDSARFSIDPALAHLGVRTTTVLHFLPPGKAERVFSYPGNPGVVRLDPSWMQAALTFVELGFKHIMDGIDHLLFVLCLVIPVRRLRPLIGIVTSFTVAHSITLIASASGFAPNALWFPPLIEVLIAISIVYMALENIVGAKIERRWMIAFAFGLVHGFGFSFALRESLQFAGSHLVTSLLTFNAGVELGQITVLLVTVPLLAFIYKRVVAERMGVIILSAIVAHTAWHWMLERGSALRQYEFQWPALDAAFMVQAMRVLMFALILAAAMWMLNGLVRRMARPAAQLPDNETARAEK